MFPNTQGGESEERLGHRRVCRQGRRCRAVASPRPRNVGCGGRGDGGGGHEARHELVQERERRL